MVSHLGANKLASSSTTVHPLGGNGEIVIGSTWRYWPHIWGIEWTKCSIKVNNRAA
jgi:hypothetical protein